MKGSSRRITAQIISALFFIIVLPLIGIYLSSYIDDVVGFNRITNFPYNTILGLLIFTFGSLWTIWSNMDLFKKGKGSPVPLKRTETTQLVISGHYIYTRNPMAFGYLCILVGLGFFVNSISMICIFSIIVLVLLIVMIKFWEEKKLEDRFGLQYVNYKKKVSFLIPLPQRSRYG